MATVSSRCSSPAGLSTTFPPLPVSPDYTRRGDFQVNANGHLVNGAGYYLMGVAVDPKTGNPLGNVPQVLQFQNNFIPAQTTTSIHLCRQPAFHADDGDQRYVGKRYNQCARGPQSLRFQRQSVADDHAGRAVWRQYGDRHRCGEPGRIASPDHRGDGAVGHISKRFVDDKLCGRQYHHGRWHYSHIRSERRGRQPAQRDRQCRGLAGEDRRDHRRSADHYRRRDHAAHRYGCRSLDLQQQCDGVRGARFFGNRDCGAHTAPCSGNGDGYRQRPADPS